MGLGESVQSPQQAPWQLDPEWQFPPSWQYPPNWQYPKSFTLESRWMLAVDFQFAPDPTFLESLLGYAPASTTNPPVENALEGDTGFFTQSTGGTLA